MCAKVWAVSGTLTPAAVIRCPPPITSSDTRLLREPLLYAASEHRVVGVPTSVFHTRVRARDDVSASVQCLQPKRVVPVKLSAGQKRRSVMVQTEQTKTRLSICLQLTSWFVISTMFSLLSKNAKWLRRKETVSVGEEARTTTNSLTNIRVTLLSKYSAARMEGTQGPRGD